MLHRESTTNEIQQLTTYSIASLVPRNVTSYPYLHMEERPQPVYHNSVMLKHAKQNKRVLLCLTQNLCNKNAFASIPFLSDPLLAFSAQLLS